MNPSTPRLRARLLPLGAALLLGAACLLVAAPRAAWAQTDKEDWRVSSSLAVNADPTDLEVVLNVGECRDQVSGAGDESFSFDLVSGALGAAPRYAVKVAIGNEQCDEKVLEDVAEDTCITEVEDQALSETLIPIDVAVDFAQLSSAKVADDCENLQETAYVYLAVHDPPLLGTDPGVYTVTYTVRISAVRPEAPSNVEATAGEESILVSWDEVADASGYRVYTSTAAITAGALPETLAATRTSADGTTSVRVTGATANQTYYVAVTSLDDDLNESLVGEVVTVQTGVVDDYWERYRAENPEVDGGYCFLATAAWGSYQEPHVQVLRRFRDEVLLPTAAGRAFVDAYYATSPPLADFIARHEAVRAAARAALWPVYGVAVLTLFTGLLGKLLLLLAAALFLHLLWRLWPGGYHRRAARRQPPAVTLAWAGVLVALLAVPAVADAEESPVDMVVEVKAGPYRPENLGDTFTAYFGEDSATMWEFEFDWQFYRGIGSAGVAASIGFASVTGHGLTPDGAQSVDETSLDWMPLRLALVYRFDYLWTRLGVPFALYGKLGLDYYVWWISDGAGDVATDAGGQSGSGGTFGWHAALGGAFVLDWLAPRMAQGFDVEWGVNNSYLFAELLYAQIDGFGATDVLDLSDGTGFLIGLALEF